MPEVLEQEIRKQLARVTLDEAARFREASLALADLGIRQVDEPPFSQSSLADLAQERLQRLEAFLLRVPLTLSHARRALARVNAELPPNGPRDQEFKDSAIWEAVLELGREHNVIFVTGDKGFFKDRDPGHGLAENLIRDCQEPGLLVTVIYSANLESIIGELQKGVPQLDEAKVLDLVGREVERVARDELPSGRNLGRGLDQRASAYLTGVPGVLAVAFELDYAVTQAQDDGPGKHGRLSIEGSCEYRPDGNRLDRVSVARYTIWWDAPGTISAETWGPAATALLKYGAEGGGIGRDRLGELPIAWTRPDSAKRT